MNIGIIIQARMGSSRFPGKILKKFYNGKSLLETILDNLHKIEDTKIIIAISNNTNDDILENYLKEKGELFFRGSENDVLDRFIKTAENFNLDGVIRICSDNPFTDFKEVAKLIDKAKKSKADYIGFRINNLPSIISHFGFWGEFVSLESLIKVAKTTEDKSAHEHVTSYLYSHPNLFNCEWIDCPDFLQGRNDIRLTIDTLEDMANAQKVFADLKFCYPEFGIKEIVEYVDQHDELKLSMKLISDKYKK